MLGDATGHDSIKMLQVGFDVDADAVKADPLAQPNPDCGDLVLCGLAVRLGTLVRALNPDTLGTSSLRTTLRNSLTTSGDAAMIKALLSVSASIR